MKLVDVLKRFAVAGANAAEAAAKTCSDTVLEYFKDGKPETIPLTLEGVETQVPVIALTNPPQLGMDEMSLEFGASVNIDSEEEICMHNHYDLLNKGINVDIKMVFKSQDSPEGLELVRDKLNKELSENLQTPGGAE